MFPILLAHLRVERVGNGRPRTRPDLLRADKAYSSYENRAVLRRRRIRAVISEPRNQTANRRRRPGRPILFDAADYRGRNVVERGFCETKQWRGLATRYDKLAIVYRGAAVLRAITLWLKSG
jgi:putative transposase